MRCPQCQEENPPRAKFCSACGTRFEVLCPACAHPNVPGSRFCNECGQALGDVAVSAPATKLASPQAQIPTHLAEKILGSRSALEGERKQVTVLFADLKGSMELLANRDPEDARKLLDPVLEQMMEAVHRYEGTVNQVMGDGIMALFGAPLAHEDHAVRACYAALRMQEGVKRYAEQVQRSIGVPIHVRVGLNSGEVVVRSIGSDLHMDYTAVGQTTHLAARMEQMAMPGSILLTANVLQLAEGYMRVTPLGPVPVKGLEAPIEVYELTGAGPARSRLQAAAARGLTRFIGISGHNRPGKFLKVLQEYDIDVMMNAVNFVDRWTYGFEQEVWPEAAKRNIGLVAMKVFGGASRKAGSYANPDAPPELALEHLELAVRYALSTPGVATVNLGVHNQEQVRKNVAMVKRFKPLAPDEQAGVNELGKKLAQEWGPHFGPVA